MKKYSILFFLIFTAVLFAQEETQIPFDKKSNLMEITSKSLFDSLGKSFHPNFQKILLFQSGESFVLEIYFNIDGKLQRKRQVLSNEEYLKLVEQVEKSSATQQKFGKTENREDLRWDFVIDQTALAQYHSFAWQDVLNIDAPIFLLVSGSSYFVVDNIASKLELNRFNVLNMRQAHINGLTQGFILGTMLSDIKLFEGETETVTNYYDGSEEERLISWPPPWVQIALLLSSGLGIYNTYDTYNDTKIETNPGLYTLTKSIELYSLSTLPLLALTILPDKTLESLDKATFWSTLSLVPSLTARYWVPKYFSDYSFTVGDAMIAENIMIYTFATGALSLNIFNTDSRFFYYGILTASEIAGLYFGTNYANGKNFTYKDSRHVSTFAVAGATAGIGLSAVLGGDFDTGIKLLSALTIAGLWGGFAYGINTLENENTSYLFPENFQLSIHPELLVASNSLNQISRKPIHIPIIQLKYNW